MAGNLPAGVDPDTPTLLLYELSEMYDPLVSAGRSARTGDTQELATLLTEMHVGREVLGERATAVEDEVKNVVTEYDSGVDPVVSKLVSGNADAVSVADVFDAGESLASIHASLQELNDLSVRDTSVRAVGDQVNDYLLVRYLYEDHNVVHDLLSLLGVIRNSAESEFRKTVREQEKPVEVDLTAVPALFEDAAGSAGAAFGWASEEFQARAAIAFLGGVLRSTGLTDPSNPSAATLDVPFGPPSGSGFPLSGVGSGGLGWGVDAGGGELDGISPSLDLSAADIEGLSGDVSLGAGAFPVFPDAGASAGGLSLPGVGFVPFRSGPLPDDASLDLGGGWRFDWSRGGSASLGDFGLALGPGALGEFVDLTSGSAIDRSLEITTGIAFDPTAADPGFRPVLGDPDGTALEVGSIGTEFDLAVGPDTFDLGVGLPSTWRLRVSPQGGFLEKVLPEEVVANFQLTPNYRLGAGIGFRGSGSLDVPVPTNVELGPVTIPEVFLSLGLDPGGGGGSISFPMEVALSANTKLGPFSASITRVGLDVDLSLAPDGDGNLGPLDLDVGFKPPDGLGLSLDEKAVSGGGAIQYEPEHERYAGTFQLSIGPVEVKVMGLLTTELPDGRDGFSLLVSVFAESLSVQLGFGFTLTGLGGVLGVNRSLQSQALGRAVRTGNLDSVLFPEDPVANSQRIISDLRSIYPPTRGQHLLGPMARFGWGTPPIILLDLGVVLQFPRFKFSVLGNLAVGLPSVELPDPAQLIRLNFAVAGTLAPAERLFEVSASLYDSRVVLWTVKGGMAMRTRWGEKPQFVLSVGGFNPRFDPPGSMPDVDRVRVCMGIPGGNPSVEWRGYFAVTSNTVQVGASFEASFSVGVVSARAWWSLDALFQFNPFKFVVDFEAGISVSLFGLSMSLTLSGTLKGPSPVVINGQLTIETPWPFPNPSPQVHFELGEDKSTSDSLPTPNLLPKFRDELTTPRNWSTQAPEDGEGIVSLRSMDDRGEGSGSGGGDASKGSSVLAHPLASVAVRQTVVPIERSVERHGETKPQHDRYEFGIDTSGSAEHPPMEGYLKEPFAPDQYQKLTDSQKMKKPAFREWKAGRRAGNDLFYWGCVVETGSGKEKKSENSASGLLAYEHKQYDSVVERWLPESADGGVPRPGPYERTDTGYPVAHAAALADDGAVANTPRRSNGQGEFVPDEPGPDEVTVRTNLGPLDDRIQVAEDAAVLDVPGESVEFGGESG